MSESLGKSIRNQNKVETTLEEKEFQRTKDQDQLMMFNQKSVIHDEECPVTQDQLRLQIQRTLNATQTQTKDLSEIFN